MVIFRYTRCTKRAKTIEDWRRGIQFWQLQILCSYPLSESWFHLNAVSMFSVQNVTVDTSVAVIKFACNLSQCKGACCTMPGPRGAPLTVDESKEIEKAFPVVGKYLNDDHLRVIDERGLVERSGEEVTTPCFDHRACVFVTYDNGVAKCSFEKAYFKNEIGWRKPLSCHLFPIRVHHGLNDHLRYESIPECSPALERGLKENIALSDFLKDALVRQYGEPWYMEFQKACASQKTGLLMRAGI